MSEEEHQDDERPEGDLPGETADVPPPTDETIEDGASARAQAASGAVRDTFARYEILDELGRGGMGIVYRARDPKLKRVVALKVLIAGEDASQEQVVRFFREAESAARLRHPNIVPIHELDVHEGKHYFTMDYVEGTPLDELIASGKLDARRAVEIIEEVARGVHYAHEQGIVHRDLKPSNVIISQDGRPMVMDFGLAKEVESDLKLTRSGYALGTPAYMPPEQAEARLDDIDARSDVYSLGAVLYEMLARRPPFVASNLMALLRMAVEEDPVRPRVIDPRIPRDAEVISLKCLEKDPRRRYQSGQELTDDCRRFLEGEPIRARPASLVYRARKRLARHKAASAVTALALAVVVGLTIWYVISVQSALEEARRERDRAETARRAEEEQRKAAEAARLSEVEQRKLAEERRMEAEEQRRRAEEKVQELRAASSIQANLLPSKMAQVPGYDFYAWYRSAREVSGDYYDFIALDRERLALVVADASGKGAPGSIIMATICTILHMVTADSSSPSEILKKTNLHFGRANKRGTFVTAMLAVLNVRRNEIDVCSGGHDPMVIYRERTGRCELVNPLGIAVGFDRGPVFDRLLQQEHVRLFPGDRVVMLTGGLVQARNPDGDMFGYDRLCSLAQQHADVSSKKFVGLLVDTLGEHMGVCPQEDDMAILTFRVEETFSAPAAFRKAWESFSKRETQLRKLADALRKGVRWKEVLSLSVRDFKTRGGDWRPSPQGDNWRAEGGALALPRASEHVFHGVEFLPPQRPGSFVRLAFTALMIHKPERPQQLELGGYLCSKVGRGQEGYLFDFGGFHACDDMTVILKRGVAADEYLSRSAELVPEAGRSYRLEAIRLGPLLEFVVDGDTALAGLDYEVLRPEDGYTSLGIYGWGDGARFARFSDIKVYLPENPEELEAILKSISTEE